MEFTDKQKDKLLLSNGWEKITGYAMGYEAPDSDNVIITIDEIKKCIFNKPTDYYVKEKYETCIDLEAAWEDYYDDCFDKVLEQIDIGHPGQREDVTDKMVDNFITDELNNIKEDIKMDYFEKLKVTSVTPLKLTCAKCGSVRYNLHNVYKEEEAMPIHVPACANCVKQN